MAKDKLESVAEASKVLRVANAIKAAWEQFGDVPFPLYDREAYALAQAAIAAMK